MNDAYQLKQGHRTVSSRSFLAISISLLLAISMMTCVITWPVVAQDQQVGMLRFMASGPIQIEVHDPEGNIASRVGVQIEGASFQDEDDEITIEIPHPIVGDYLVHMNTDGSAIRLQHFDIWVTDGIDTIQLADYQLIVNAPTDPYMVRVSSIDFTDVTADAADDQDSSEGSMSNLVWILVACGGGLVGLVLIIRSRKQKKY